MHKIVGGILAGATVLLPMLCLILPAPQSGNQGGCPYAMRHISLALKTYADAHDGRLPPAYIADENGKPMHSWRVLLLPYFEEQALFDKYNFDEPWNGPNNSRLGQSIPRVYQCQEEYAGNDGSQPWTSYVAVVGPHSMWPGAEPGSLDKIPDGPNHALLLVEVRNSGIHWMEPRDLNIDDMNPRINGQGRLGISSVHPQVAHVVFADGHGGPLSEQLRPEILRQLIQIDDGGPSDADY